MNAKEFQSAVIIKLDSCMREMREIKRAAKELEVKVENIAPQSHVHPIHRPPQKEVGRDLNIATWFRQKTGDENSKLPKNAPRKYLEFPAHISEEQLNEEMKRCMYYIMCGRLKPGWETKNWNTIYNSDKILGEQIVKEAALRPEMAVIAQSSGYWAIRKIAEQRQKSTKRSVEQRKTRVTIKKENKGSFGSRARIKKNEVVEKDDHTNLIAAANDRIKKNELVVGNDDDANLTVAANENSMSEGDYMDDKDVDCIEEVPVVEREVAIEETVANMPRFTDDVVSVVEDLETYLSSGEDKLEVKKETDDVEEEKLTMCEIADDQKGKENETVSLLQSLTKEQLLALLFQTETRRNVEKPQVKKSASDEKRKRNDVEVSKSIGKLSGIQNPSKRTRKAGSAGEKKPATAKMVVRNSKKSRR